MGKLTKLLNKRLLVTMMVNFLGSLQYGYNLGLLGNIQNVVTDFMNETITERNGEGPSEDLLLNLWGIIAAILFLGGAVGAISNRWITSYFTRRRAFVLNNVVGAVGGILMTVSRRSGIWEFVLVGRLIMGIHTGIYTGLVPLYLSEISPKEVRGAVTNLSALGMTLAAFLGITMGFPNLFGTPDLWDVIMGLTFLPLTIQLLILPICVESPRYLMINQRDTEAARHALQMLRGTDDVEDEIEEMRGEMVSMTEMSLVELFKHPAMRRATVLAMLAQMTLHLSGGNGVLYYANNIFQESVNLSSEVAAYMVAAVGFTCFSMCIVATPLSEMAGRRPLQIVGHVGSAFSATMICVSLAFRDDVEGFGIASVVFVIIFVIFLGIGPVTIPWILTGELFTQNARPVASAIAVTSNWICGFLVAYSFAPLLQVLQAWVFIPFASCSVFFAAYSYFHQPETKGKSQQEITLAFERPGDQGKAPQYTACQKGDGGESGNGNGNGDSDGDVKKGLEFIDVTSKL